jgi:hypothetical protein
LTAGAGPLVDCCVVLDGDVLEVFEEEPHPTARTRPAVAKRASRVL